MTEPREGDVVVDEEGNSVVIVVVNKMNGAWQVTAIPEEEMSSLD